MANDPTVHKVASYNMSFASDQGSIIGSEKHFISDTLKRLGQHPEENPHGDTRSAWERAAELVHHFWLNQAPSAMGFQEMNMRARIRDKRGGYERMLEILSDIPDLQFYANGVPHPYGFPTVLTIWNGRKLGHGIHNSIADLGQDEGFNQDARHIGRPISIVYTDKGFTLINLHGPNWSEESYNDDMKFLRAAINKHVGLFIQTNHLPGLDINKIFVMGDFNDPFNAINFNNPLIINDATNPNNSSEDGKKVFYSKNKIDGIKSCCYNFNSACTLDDLNLEGELPGYSQGERATKADGRKADPYECFIHQSANPAIDERISPGTIKKTAKETYRGKDLDLSVGTRGYLDNYQFTGDYVMGANVVEDLQIYRKGTVFDSPVSLESDHEMVFASFRSPVAGGRRKRRTRHKKHTRRTRHKRHTRRK
jgi:hypothetical protein